LRFSRLFPAFAALGFALCAVPAAAPADAPSGQPVGGIRCDRTEGVAFHIHQHIALYDRGRMLTVPADIGRPVMGECLYWLHTHTPDGIIHVESPVARVFTLGDFFRVWGVPLSTKRAGPLKSATPLHFYVNGMLYHGDPSKIELAQHTDIVVQAGPPWVKTAPFTEWNGQ